MTPLRTTGILMSALLAGACTTLTPDYERPGAPVPASFPGATANSEAPVVADIAWRDYFADQRLRELIELALTNNRDLRVSALNIEQARAQYRIQRADSFPAINAGVGQTAQRLPGDLTSSGKPTINRQYSATVGLSAWELDFFGRVRSLSAQALETYLGTEEARRSAPALKIGRLSWGTKLQVPEPDPNRPSSVELAVPALAVSVMRGKKAARAAPMLALAARSWRSACRTSGRRVSTDEGTPASSSGRAVAASTSLPGSSSAGTGAPTSRASAFSSRATCAV